VEAQGDDSIPANCRNAKCRPRLIRCPVGQHNAPDIPAMTNGDCCATKCDRNPASNPCLDAICPMIVKNCPAGQISAPDTDQMAKGNCCAKKCVGQDKNPCPINPICNFFVSPCGDGEDVIPDTENRKNGDCCAVLCKKKNPCENAKCLPIPLHCPDGQASVPDFEAQMTGSCCTQKCAPINDCAYVRCAAINCPDGQIPIPDLDAQNANVNTKKRKLDPGNLSRCCAQKCVDIDPCNHVACPAYVIDCPQGQISVPDYDEKKKETAAPRSAFQHRVIVRQRCVRPWLSTALKDAELFLIRLRSPKETAVLRPVLTLMPSLAPVLTPIQNEQRKWPN